VGEWEKREKRKKEKEFHVVDVVGGESVGVGVNEGVVVDDRVTWEGCVIGGERKREREKSFVWVVGVVVCFLHMFYLLRVWQLFRVCYLKVHVWIIE
jgi:hypothetical protein